MLMADGVLQIFYIVIGVIGLWSWIRGSHQGVAKPIITSRESKHFIAIAVCILLSYPLSWLLIHYADARYGYPDTLLTLLSVWATILLIRKDLSNWVYWMGIDVIYIFLYWKTEGYLFAFLFLIYAIVSVWGWVNWRKQFKMT
jgi:nicotinamide mononucleotide transporter